MPDLYYVYAVINCLFVKVLGLQWLLGTKALWPLLLGLTGVFVLYQVLVLPACPDSPRYIDAVVQEVAEASERWYTLSRLRLKQLPRLLLWSAAAVT